MKAFANSIFFIKILFLKKTLTRSVRKTLEKTPLVCQLLSDLLFDIRFVEPKVFRFLSNIILKDWVCFDIGAHCGVVSKLLLRSVGDSGYVYSFEPIDSNRDILNSRVQKYSTDKNFKAIPYAIGSKDEVVQMSRGDHSTTWHFDNENNGIKSLNIECRALDSFAAILKKPDFIKVDIEGAEVDMIQGAKYFIENVRPIWLIELHGPESWSICDRFLEKNYVIFDLDGLNISYQHSTANSYGHAVFCPVEKLSLLK